jgi:hypothetical protein
MIAARSRVQELSICLGLGLGLGLAGEHLNSVRTAPGVLPLIGFFRKSNFIDRLLQKK